MDDQELKQMEDMDVIDKKLMMLESMAKTLLALPGETPVNIAHGMIYSMDEKITEVRETIFTARQLPRRLC